MATSGFREVENCETEPTMPKSNINSRNLTLKENSKFRRISQNVKNTECQNKKMQLNQFVWREWATVFKRNK